MFSSANGALSSLIVWINFDADSLDMLPQGGESDVFEGVNIEKQWKRKFVQFRSERFSLERSYRTQQR